MRLRVVSSLIILLFLVSCEKENDVILNVVPVADAGAPIAITLPTNTVTLTGTGTDSDGTIVAYLWSQVSGPAATVIVNPGSPSTAVNGLVQGNYVFQLMVTDDDGATGVDTVSVSVSQAPQQTLTLQPSNNPNEKMLISIGGVDQSSQGGNEWAIDAWTVNGAPYFCRGVFKFNLSAIPNNATIVSANLYLYSNSPPENGNFIDANFGPTNGLILRRIISDWSPGSANWSNQPTTTTTNEVLIPSTTQSVLDLNLDVTALVATMVNTGTNYGFLLRLQNEVTYNSRAFVSSYHATKVAKHPKLVVVYR